jgi:hypothetical protein
MSLSSGIHSHEVAWAVVTECEAVIVSCALLVVTPTLVSGETLRLKTGKLTSTKIPSITAIASLPLPAMRKFPRVVVL